MKQPQINSLGWLASVGASLFFGAIENLAIAKIENEQQRDVATAMVSKVRSIVALLTDSDKENAEQLKAWFGANWRELVQILGKLARLLLEAHVQVPEWVKGILVKLESGEF